MSKGSNSLAELLKEVQAGEGIIGHQENLQVAENCSSFSTKKSKKNKKGSKTRCNDQVESQG